MARRRPARDSRRDILAAAGAEFASRGFAGGGVDRIAKRAGVNKAMIYYHFASKAGLYREIIREMFAATGARFAAIADGARPPAEKLDALVEALLAAGQARPHLAPVLLRELAEGGAHLDRQTLQLIAQPFQAVRRVIAAGVASGDFAADVHPLLAYFTLVGPVILYLGNAPVRARMEREKLVDMSGAELPAFRAHVQDVLRRALAARDGPARAARRGAPAPAPPAPIPSRRAGGRGPARRRLRRASGGSPP